MRRARPHELHAKRWGLALLVVILIGTCGVAYAYSGEQLPKNSATPMVIALAASFGVK